MAARTVIGVIRLLRPMRRASCSPSEESAMKVTTIFGCLLAVPALVLACSGDDDDDATLPSGGRAGQTGTAGRSGNGGDDALGEAGSAVGGGATGELPGRAGPADAQTRLLDEP